MVISLTDIRNNVESAVSVFLATQQERVRDIMRRTVMLELRRNKISRLWCKDFKVYLTKDGVGFDTMNLSLDGDCPKCGEGQDSTKLLTVYYPDTSREEHVRGCRCGCIYKILWGC